MIPPSLDFTSNLFDPYEALHCNKVPLPYPKAKTYNNISDYYSRTFLKKGYDSNKLSRKQEGPRERNYEWYYNTLGLSEYQRNFIHCFKKNKRRKRKKPVSLVTIPGSPLRSKKVTVCKSDFKDYWRRKYRSLNIASGITNIKSQEFEDFSSDNTSESSFMPSVIKTKHSNSLSVLPYTEYERERTEPTSPENECPSPLFCTLTSESPSLLPVIDIEFSSTSGVVKSEPYDSSDDDSCLDDDILILKMKSNVQEGCMLINDESSISFQLRQEPLDLPSNCEYVNINPKCLGSDPHQIANDQNLSNICKPDHLNTSDVCSLYANIHIKSRISLNDPEIASSSSQAEDSTSASETIQKKGIKKHKKCDEIELKLKNHKIQKQKKKHDNYKDNSNLLDSDQTQKSSASCQKECVIHKENSSMKQSKSEVKLIKTCKKSALKSQENVSDCKKLSSMIEVVTKSNNLTSKIKIENSQIINHCTCNFPCGLSHLCTCGYYANAKEALRKFKIPHKKK